MEENAKGHDDGNKMASISLLRSIKLNANMFRKHVSIKCYQNMLLKTQIQQQKNHILWCSGLALKQWNTFENCSEDYLLEMHLNTVPIFYDNVQSQVYKYPLNRIY